MNNLSRNVPTALVVGAAGFIGSHLTDRLLEKGIQVVGVDDLSRGSMENLSEAVKNSRFHLIKSAAEDGIPLQFAKLNYAFFIVSEDISSQSFLDAWDSFLKVCQTTKCKIVLVSSIRLYNPHEDKLNNLRKAEKILADFATKNNLNARIVRLATVFGPRSHFREDDPVIHLLKAAIKGDLQKETTALDFTTRAIYINDAVDLLVKALMHGSTSQKIYDGALSVPIKVAEIKQVLLDPLWHEQKGFAPTELPPWPSPNLMKTIKELSWHPRNDIVQSLKETLHYFKGRNDLLEDKMPRIEEEVSGKVKEMREFLEGEEGKVNSEQAPAESGAGKSKKIVINYKRAGQQTKKYLLVSVGLALILYAFVYPLSNLVFGIYSYKIHLQNSLNEVSKGNFGQAKQEIDKANQGARAVGEVVGPLALVGNLSVLKPEVTKIKLLASLLEDNTDAVGSAIAAGSYFEQGIKAISGEEGSNPQQYFDRAVGELDKAERTLSYTDARLTSGGIPAFLPGLLKKEIELTQSKTKQYKEVINFSKSVAFIIPPVIGTEGRKTYLVLLEDNTILRPGGGAISAYGEITFDKGKLVNIQTGNIDTLDQKFTENLAAPAEVAADLGKPRWTMQNSNFDADFPSSAKLAAWFYQKEAGVGVAGVMMMDLTALQKILDSSGPLTLSSTGEKITSSNLLESVKNAPNRKEFLNALLNSFLNKTFYVTKQDWLGSAEAMQAALMEKHLLFYFTDPSLLSYTAANNWSGVFLKQAAVGIGERNEFLATFESDLESNIPNYYLNRKLNLETTINQEGEVAHRLAVDYTSSPQFGGDVNGRIRKRLKFYLPAGSKLTSAKLGSTDITKSVNTFVDYGRVGYSFVYDVRTQTPTNLIFEYQNTKPLEFVGDRATFKINLMKQPGTGNDKLNYSIAFPEGWVAESKDFGKQDQKLNISADLSKDLSYQVIFKKPAKL